MVTHSEKAKALTPGGLEVRIARLHFFPQFPHTEIKFADVNVVEEHHAPFTHLRQPVFKIAPDCLIGMEAVDMQQIDRAILEVRQRLIESGLDEAGKAAIERIVMALELSQYLRAVVAVMWVALPGINRVAACAGAQFLHGLAEGTE